MKVAAREQTAAATMLGSLDIDVSSQLPAFRDQDGRNDRQGAISLNLGSLIMRAEYGIAESQRCDA
jgi:hypothetical protein